MELLRSLLFVPGMRERMVEHALRSDADAVVLDLEDSVPEKEKKNARRIARRAIPLIAASGRSAFVRVNGLHTDMTRDDLLAVVGRGLTGVVLPKTESPQDLRDLDVLLREAELEHGVRPGDVRSIPLIESARGVLRCEDIVHGSDRVLALSIGAEDYTLDLGVPRDADGVAIQHLRAVVVHVAAAYGFIAIDTPYPDVRDEAGLVAEARLARTVGFKGKYLIHPEQVAPVHAVFSPSKDEIAHARRMIAAYEDGVARGLGAVNVDGRMVDAPIAARARDVLALDAAIRRRARQRRRAAGARIETKRQ